MVDAARAIPGVTVVDLYETYPDFAIDVPREQALVEEADLLVLQHPLQWYGMPSLQKEWFDQVLEHNWAYGSRGAALAGKHFWLSVTTGGQSDAYSEAGEHGYPFEAFLPPYRQTALLCGMRWLEPLVMHGSRQAEEAAITAHVNAYRDRLAAYPAWASASADTANPVS
jgi:glutathione-regulated potassium-efflux system ancillary protein KefF